VRTTQKANGRPLGGVVVPSGDMGLGLCLQCLGELLAGDEKAGPPRFAITLAPMPQQIPTPQGVIVALVAVPACWDHLAGAAEPKEQKRPLLVAGSGLR
jgi:hypothetical protein